MGDTGTCFKFSIPENRTVPFSSFSSILLSSVLLEYL
jgi:hypothetical protein